MFYKYWVHTIQSIHKFAATPIAFISHERKQVVIQFLIVQKQAHSTTNKYTNISKQQYKRYTHTMRQVYTTNKISTN